MQKNKIFNFNYSYLTLPKKFYSLTNVSKFSKPKVFQINDKLLNTLKVPLNNKENLTRILLKTKYDRSFSQAYAGHQFGHFTNLGDGRAIIIGEQKIDKEVYDIQLKGCGSTPYSRNGDGRATLKSMLKEYLISEAMYYLNIPTSRSLAVFKTGDFVYRTNKEKGAILARIMKSHIRVGTFEFASYLCSKKDLMALKIYTINRSYPELIKYENPALELLIQVMQKQIDLVVNWMRVGFIHGVMNTDNTSISGETFDYGPCAFINSYNPNTTYSSIDYNRRYSFGNQPIILKWNISRFAESLLPIIHNKEEKAIQLAQSVIDQFDEIWENKYYGMMLKKVGIKNNNKKLYPLIDEILNYMQKNKKDYNNTFLYLSHNSISDEKINDNSDFKQWYEKWREKIFKISNIKEDKELMKIYNPIIIPRNHIVEKAIDEACNGDLNLFNKFLKVISDPNKNKGLNRFLNPPNKNFEENFQTFCGT